MSISFTRQENMDFFRKSSIELVVCNILHTHRASNGEYLIKYKHIRTKKLSERILGKIRSGQK